MHTVRSFRLIVVYLLADGRRGLVGGAGGGRATRESYFLAGKSLPWWIIGVAHGSSGIDITGTMWFVTMLFVYGVKATWLLWVWPLFNVIFRMVYLGTWVRRSNVLTGAEWMRTRFGYRRGRRTGLPERGGLCPGERGGLPQLRLPRDRQVHRAVPAVGFDHAAEVYAHGHPAGHRRLLRRRRHVQRGDERPDPVRADPGGGGRASPRSP